jgi:hypothetical protein
MIHGSLWVAIYSTPFGKMFVSGYQALLKKIKTGKIV